MSSKFTNFLAGCGVGILGLVAVWMLASTFVRIRLG